MLLGALAGLAAILVVAFTLLVRGGTGPDRAKFEPNIAAHRGGALLWAENSRLAFARAVALGVEYLELDVHLSRDDEAVVIHDATLERTTTGQGPVRERTLAELRALRLRGPDGTEIDQGVPTLDEIVALGMEGRRRLLVEIKTDQRRQRYPGIEEIVLEILDRHHAIPASVVMAFEEATWRRVRELRPEVRAGALYSPRMLEAQRRTVAEALAGAAREGLAFVGLQHSLVTAETVAEARRLGILLGAWTVNEDADLARVMALGPDVLITDRPDAALRRRSGG